MAASGQDNWRSDCLATRLDNARKEARYTDVEFVVGNAESKRVFHAHKAILACGSPVFDKMFYGPMAEKRDTIETDDDPEAFEILINYIYGKQNRVLSLISAWKFFTIGDKYLVPKILDVAKGFIDAKPLTEESFWEIVENNIFSNPLFLHKINCYMMENTNRLIASTKFLNVPENFIYNLLQVENSNIQEYQLLLAVSKWINQTKYQTPIKLYKHIRFSSLTMDEFFLFLDSYPTAIDVQSSLEILRHLHNPSRHNLPKWCSKSKVSRTYQTPSYASFQPFNYGNTRPF